MQVFRANIEERQTSFGEFIIFAIPHGMSLGDWLKAASGGEFIALIQLFSKALGPDKGYEVTGFRRVALPQACVKEILEQDTSKYHMSDDFSMPDY